jgi:hypothetical protein
LPEREQSDRGAGGKEDDTEHGDHGVRGLEQHGAQTGSEREEQTTGRPGGDHREAGEQERTSNASWDARTLDCEPEPSRGVNRFRHRAHSSERDREQSEEYEVRDHSR